MHKKAAVVLSILIGAAIVVFILLSLTSGLIQQWPWMQQVGYLNIFWRLLSVKWALWGLSFLAVFFYTWINFQFAARTTAAFSPAGDGNIAWIYTNAGQIVFSAAKILQIRDTCVRL